MEDIGSLVFYVLLGVIALVGSIQGKNKKKAAQKNVIQRKPATTAARPATQPSPSQSPLAKAAQQRPQYMSANPSREGRNDDPPTGTFNNGGSFRKFLAEAFGEEGSMSNPMADTFSSEGSMSNPMADAFSNEGSMRNTLADAFSKEGSVSGGMAAAFTSEGSSVFFDASLTDFVHNEISDSEIGDAPEYDYNVMPGSGSLSEDFNLRKAVIYSAVLSRKEYSY